MSRRITMRLRIAIDIRIGVHALQVPLRAIRRQEHADDLVVVAGIVVIQPRAVVVLPGEAFERVDGACVVARVAVRPKHLVPLDRRPPLRHW